MFESKRSFVCNRDGEFKYLLFPLSIPMNTVLQIEKKKGDKFCKL